MIKILSIDGGGIRGIIPAKILTNLELALRNKSGNENLKIGECFDLIAGTSTGGIIASCLLCPDQNGQYKYSAKDILDFYMKRGEAIFSTSLWKKIQSADGLLDEKYDNTELKVALSDYLGDIKLSQLKKPCLITAYDIRNRKATFFNQMDAISDPSMDFFIKDIAYSTAAAPTYFECSRIKSNTDVKTLVDGGLFANNPALCAYAEVRNKFKGNPSAKDMMIVSLGTGSKSEHAYSFEEAKDWGLVEWIKPLINIVMSSGSEVVDYQLRQMFNTVIGSGKYYRVNNQLKFSGPELDNASLKNLINLEKDGDYFWNNCSNIINDIINDMKCIED